MKRPALTLLVFLFFCASVFAQSIQEKLGYPKNAKLLIIHADDLGVAHSENAASFTVLEKGAVNSASILVPCPWFPEAAAYAKDHPTADIGVHLAITSEWKLLKWKPVAPVTKVPSLVDKYGFFYADTPGAIAHAKPDEVETELRAQIDRALAFGVDVTHLDSHMGTVVSHPDLIKIYLKLGQEYKVPVLMLKGVLDAAGVDHTSYLTNKGVVLDNVMIASPDDYKTGMKNFYTKAIQAVQPGLTCLLLHAAYDNDEMQAVTIDHPDYGAAWRQADFDFFMSDECKALLKKENIHLVTWREIRDKIVRK